MIYLDNAATTFPKPQCMVDEISRCIKKYCGNPGRSSHFLSVKSAEKIYECRSLLANMLGAEAENIVFTYNTTYALNIAIKSLLKYSTHVLISDIEHNSVYRPILSCKKQKLCDFDIFSTNGTDEEIIRDIKNKIRFNTSMIICTHQSNVGERVLPIKKIGSLCSKHGLAFIVDGAQSAGIHKINVKEMNISALCLPAHKGLYGPQGLGIIAFNENVLGRSIIEGGTGINSLEPDMPDFLPEAYEAGTMSTPLIAGLSESLKWLNDIGIDNIRVYEEELYKVLVSNLKTIKGISLYKMNSYNGNNIMFNLNNISPITVGSILTQNNICVRSGFHCAPLAHKVLNTGVAGACRISLSVFNTKSEIIKTCEIIDDISKKQKNPSI